MSRKGSFDMSSLDFEASFPLAGAFDFRRFLCRRFWNHIYILLMLVANEHERELLIIIDGLDKAEHQKGEFLRGVHALIMYLQERTSKFKALLTSRPQVE